MAVLYLLSGGKPELRRSGEGRTQRDERDPLLLTRRPRRRSVAGIDDVGDVLLATARVEAIGRDIGRNGRTRRRVDRLRGLHRRRPGFIDVHCHLREPGREDVETIATRRARGGRRRIHRGLRDAEHRSRHRQSRRPSDSSCGRRSRAHAARVLSDRRDLASARSGEALAEFGEMVDAGAVAVSDDGKPVVSAQLMRTALEYARTFGIPVADHCEEPTLAARRRDERRARVARGSVSREFRRRPKRSWPSATSCSRGARAGTCISAT